MLLYPNFQLVHFLQALLKKKEKKNSAMWELKQVLMGKMNGKKF